MTTVESERIVARTWAAVLDPESGQISCDVRDVTRDDPDILVFGSEGLHPTRRLFCMASTASIGLGLDICGCRPGKPCNRCQIDAVSWWRESERRVLEAYQRAFPSDHGGTP